MPSFAESLFDIVSDPVSADIVGWAPSGNSFVVWNEPEFSYRILTAHYVNMNWIKFEQELAKHGFNKCKHDRLEFENLNFKQDLRWLLRQIVPKKPESSQIQVLETQPHVTQTIIVDYQQIKNRLVESLTNKITLLTARALRLQWAVDAEMAQSELLMEPVADARGGMMYEEMSSILLDQGKPEPWLTILKRSWEECAVERMNAQDTMNKTQAFFKTISNQDGSSIL